MSERDPVFGYRQGLREQGLTPMRDEPGDSASQLRIAAADWGTAGQVAADLGWRWAGVWGDPRDAACTVYACLVREAAYLVLETEVPLDDAVLASLGDHQGLRRNRHA